MKTEILYEDKDLLIVRKPAGLATQTARTGEADVVSELKNYLAASGVPKPPYLGIIHRLDQPVEGLLVFAKNKRAAGALAEQIGAQGADRGMHKRYYAVLCGKPAEPEGVLVDYMYKDSQKPGRAVIAEDGGISCEGGALHCKGSGDSRKDDRNPGKGDGNPGRGGVTLQKAVLHYQILQTVQTPFGDELSLADIMIDTGRFHQIRVQMAHAGTPLLGDEKYADEAAKACSRRLGIRSVALCAVDLSLTHPVTGEALYFETRPLEKAFSFF